MSRMVTLNVKSDKIMKTFKVDGRANIKFFKTKIAPEFGNPPVPQLCLIFSGKIMKDQETLDHHNIKDNQTIHLVVKTGATQAPVSRNAPQYSKPLIDPRKPTNNTVDPKRPIDPKQSIPGKSSPSKEDAEKNEAQKPPVEEKPKVDAKQLLFGMDGIYGLPKMAEMGMGTVTYKELQQEMKEGIKQNPDLFKKHLESPFTQELMANPEIMRTLIQADPHTKEIVESNPTIFEMLNNSDVLRLTRTTGKSPEMIQNLITKIENGNFKSDKNAEKSKTGTKRKYDDLSTFWDGKMSSLLQSLYGEKESIQSFTKIPNFAEAMFETMLENSELASKALLSIPIFADNPEIQQQMKCMIPSLLHQMPNHTTTMLMGKEYGKNAIEAINQIQEALQRLHMVVPDLNDIMGVSKVGAGIDLYKFQFDTNSDEVSETSQKAKENSSKEEQQTKENCNSEKNENEQGENVKDEKKVKETEDTKKEQEPNCVENGKDDSQENIKQDKDLDKQKDKENEEEMIKGENGDEKKDENKPNKDDVEGEEKENKDNEKTDQDKKVSDENKDTTADKDKKNGNEDSEKTKKDKTKDLHETLEGIEAYRLLMSKAVKRMAEKGLDTRAEERYETELAFMDEMGFKDKRKNIQYLIASCGDMHAALQSMEAKRLAKKQRLEEKQRSEEKQRGEEKQRSAVSG